MKLILRRSIRKPVAEVERDRDSQFSPSDPRRLEFRRTRSGSESLISSKGCSSVAAYAAATFICSKLHGNLPGERTRIQWRIKA